MAKKLKTKAVKKEIKARKAKIAKPCLISPDYRYDLPIVLLPNTQGDRVR
jgi:hypothetical protein